MRRAMTIALLLGLVTVGCSGGVANDDCKPPLLQDVQAMRAIISFDHEHDLRFRVPRENWAEILDAMKPAVEDREPLKWQGLGELVVTKRGGDSVVVDLYYLEGDQGAFDVWRPGIWRPVRCVSYRGGNSAKLVKALQAAYQASQER